MGPRLALLALIIAFGFAALFATLTTVRQIEFASSSLTSHGTSI